MNALSRALRSKALGCATRGGGRPATGESSSGVVSDVVWTTLGSSVYLGAQWLTLVLIARLLGEQALGDFSLAVAITSPVILLTRLQLRSVHATDAAREWAFYAYLRVAWAGAGVALVLSIGALLVSGVETSVFILGIILVAGRAVETTSEVVYGELLRSDRVRRVAKGYVAKGVATFAAVGAGLLLGGGVLGVVIAMLAAWVLTLLAVDIPGYKALPRKQDLGARSARQPLKPLLMGAVPLGAVALLGSLKMNAPKYVLAVESGEVAVGVFTALAYFIVLGGRANQALGQAIAPRIASHFAEGRTEAVRQWSVGYVAATFGIGTIAILGALAFGEELLTVVFGPEYAPYGPVFIVVMAAGLGEYLGVTLRNLLVVLRSVRAQVFVTVGSLAVCVGLAVHLVPSFGLMGAAVAFCAGLFVEAAGHGVVLYLAVRGLVATRPLVTPVPAA